jgi:hypothetical protein
MKFCELMKASQPEWVFVDDEAFGEGWETWKFEAALSANARARAMPGEKPRDLAWRMAATQLTDYTSCLAKVAPNTNVHWYGYGATCPFPLKMFADAGINMGPSEYGQPHYLGSFADGLRQVKQRQWPIMARGRPRHLLPWLTACTYGQMTAVQAWEEALHSFGSGATVSVLLATGAQLRLNTWLYLVTLVHIACSVSVSLSLPPPPPPRPTLSSFSKVWC